MQQMLVWGWVGVWCMCVRRAEWRKLRGRLRPWTRLGWCKGAPPQVLLDAPAQLLLQVPLILKVPVMLKRSRGVFLILRIIVEGFHVICYGTLGRIHSTRSLTQDRYTSCRRGERHFVTRAYSELIRRQIDNTAPVFSLFLPFKTIK
jgi:hypothetical protein